MLKSILSTIIFGRSNGIRRGISRALFGAAPDTSPNSSFSSPTYTSAPESDHVGVVAGGSVKLEPPKDVTPPEGFEVVLHKDSLKDGDIAEVIIAGTAIAVLRDGDNIYALNSSCPHAGGPLAEGQIVHVDGQVLLRCPYHNWDFDVKSGACQTSASFDVGCYQTHVEGDAICVKL